MEWEIIVSALTAGLVYALTGYFKSAGEAWDSLKFIRTVIIGVIVGVVILGFDMEVSEAHAFIIGLGVVPIIDNILKAILRFYRNSISHNA